MSRGSYRFKQRELTRAIKGAEAAGLKISAVEIDQSSGNIIIRPAEGTGSLSPNAQGKSEWADVR